MDIRLTRNELDLVRAIVANRFAGLIETGTNPTVLSGDRQAALDHAIRIGEVLIALDAADDEEEKTDGSK